MAGGHWLDSSNAVYWLSGYWLKSAVASHWPIGQVIAAAPTTPTITNARDVKNVTSALKDEWTEPGSSSIIFGP